MNALVIGYGSIGSRHTRILKEMGLKVGVVSNRNINYAPSFKQLETALETINPEYIVIANRTSEHFSTLNNLYRLGYKKTILVEKPLFEEYKEIKENPSCYVGYDMRFYPALQKLRTFLNNNKEEVISVQAYVGQYLPQWRTNIDYRECYSASKSAGGGVLRDLSHELDYLEWIFGEWESLVAVGGHYSNLEIDSDDVFSIIFKMKKCPVVNLQMNYLDRIPRRFLIVNTNQHSVFIDFINNIFALDNQQEVIDFHADEAYRAEHLSALKNDTSYLCTFEQGLNIMKMIEAIQCSVKNRGWVFR